MEYKHFIVNAFQQRPGKWRASVKRSDGTALAVVGPHRVTIAQSITHVDSLTAEEAVHIAIEAIDAGAFSYRATPARSTEVAAAS
jgi:ActR/RegA family two-component response regulator